MSAKGGPAHHFAGPHLPIGPQRSDDDTAGDPADGARVPRCLTCGQPERSDVHLREYQLVHEGAHAGWYRLCDRCHWHANPDA